MINAEEVNSIKGLEVTTGLKEENHSSVTQIIVQFSCLSNLYFKNSLKNEITYQATTIITIMVLILKCFCFLLSGSFYDPTYNLGFYISV